jgi:hypothetical protein
MSVGRALAKLRPRLHHICAAPQGLNPTAKSDACEQSTGDRTCLESSACGCHVLHNKALPREADGVQAKLVQEECAWLAVEKLSWAAHAGGQVVQ